MKIAITGGTGFVGKELTRLLLDRGDEVTILTRTPKTTADKITYVKWLEKDAVPENQLEGVDAFINLAGTSINDGRWSEEQKKLIYTSRMDATNELLRIIHKLDKKPKVLVNASAVGIYPPSQTVTYTEASADLGSDFLAQTVRDWEILAHRAEEDGLRVACGRFGIILGKDAGALPLMALPYKMFAGGTVGSGKQWLSWIHIKDVVRALAFALDNNQLTGAFNVTAPNPKQMKDFGKEIAHALGRPHWIPVPSFAMKTALGDKSQLVLEGQRVLPTVLEQQGFQFKFPNLRSALADIYK
ncbi:NAD dependent epimerase family protein [Planococcus antarcticus DSM 14505]|uniref:NAD dependent epimerase family protein n=1 Tax=Planococcus antarcticus DSM 14505 TaxID=1185653 RepID=A0A1C7DJD4_9BACL|nr:TIGR01777 family oxidoreductase [Planococcus antarcticus]ANU11699.1 TIGR01777 family protein [Planococcus antarcticus DSM 14505]EIM05766.1 NAD dependent epimerase family protein [Planococcus antarcticus DSM 14505]